MIDSSNAGTLVSGYGVKQRGNEAIGQALGNVAHQIGGAIQANRAYGTQQNEIAKEKEALEQIKGWVKKNGGDADSIVDLQSAKNEVLRIHSMTEGDKMGGLFPGLAGLSALPTPDGAPSVPPYGSLPSQPEQGIRIPSAAPAAPLPDVAPPARMGGPAPIESLGEPVAPPASIPRMSPDALAPPPAPRALPPAQPNPRMDAMRALDARRGLSPEGRLASLRAIDAMFPYQDPQQAALRAEQIAGTRAQTARDIAETNRPRQWVPQTKDEAFELEKLQHPERATAERWSADADTAARIEKGDYSGLPASVVVQAIAAKASRERSSVNQGALAVGDVVGQALGIDPRTPRFALAPVVKHLADQAKLGRVEPGVMNALRAIYEENAKLISEQGTTADMRFDTGEPKYPGVAADVQAARTQNASLREFFTKSIAGTGDGAPAAAPASAPAARPAFTPTPAQQKAFDAGWTRNPDGTWTPPPTAPK